MGEKWDKFLLLMWKNWKLQYRKPIQTAVEILAPVIFSVLLVIIRGQADPELQDEKIYSPFCTLPFAINYPTSSGTLCPAVDNIPLLGANFTSLALEDAVMNITVLYSPSNACFNKSMTFFNHLFSEVIGLQDAQQIEDMAMNADTTYIGIEFPELYRDLTDCTALEDLNIAIRFPGELAVTVNSATSKNWLTNLVYPIFQVAGPRSPDNDTGSQPSYFKEGFSFVQHYLAASLILAKGDQDTSNLMASLEWLFVNGQFPWIQMRRFPYAPWYSDILLTAIEGMLAMIIMLSFVYTCINTVKTITTEKEKQLKESMKIMGLPNWLHWTAWFLKCFIYLIISAILVVVLLKVKWYGSDYTVFTYADASVLFVFFVLYSCSIITFCFALSVFFSKANTAATIAGLAWFISYAPFLFMQQNYASLSLSIKLLASLATNSAMAFGFQVVLMYEGTADGISWSNLFTPNTTDDNLSLGLIWIMLVINSFMYLFIALYVEAVFPGDYGVPQKWYYLFTKAYWCGETKRSEEANGISDVNNNEFFEPEPINLKAGIQIHHLKKVFGNKSAVRNLSLNMYEDQITVLLGHNGAGKTTTMSMLTGMITPTSGVARINGYDIKHEMAGVRSSLGLCPQHNIIFDELTVAEHLYFFSKLKGLKKNEIKDEIDKYIKLLDLEPKRNSKSSTLSGGMKRKLCVGIALCGNSKIVMLDEPTAGMDPSARRVLWELLQKQKEGRTMLLTTHFMDEADLLGDRIAIMAGGELQCCGSSFFLKKKYGAGYSLVMEKTKECDGEKVTQLLQKFIPEIKIHSNVGSELIYLLTENHAPVFEALLKQLEHESKTLGIQSYGISLTTLEEVFMKVGADHGQEEEYNEIENSTKNKKINTLTYDKASVSLASTHTGGASLIKNQFMAMLLKKVVSIWRSWILLAIQICIPMINLIIVFSIPNPSTDLTLPPMPLDLGRFENPVILVQAPNTIESPYTQVYQGILNDYGLNTTYSDDITSTMLTLTSQTPNTVRRRYIVGASFEEMTISLTGIATDTLTLPNITAWFNNDAYHAPGISLSFVLSAVFRQFTNCPNCKLEFTNKPLPYTAKTQLTQVSNGQTQGFQNAFNICFSMAFVSSFYVIFLVRENISKSKHLQFVSGVKVYIFWVVHAICDMTTYLITCLVLIGTMACFQQDGFKTIDELGLIFVVLLYFGCASLPLVYIASFFFDVPSTGYTRMTLLSIFTGSVAFLINTILSVPNLDLVHVADALHWVFLWFPHYSLATGINEYFTKYQTNYICNKYFTPALEQCQLNNYTYDECLAMMGDLTATCQNIDENYFAWEAHGIGRNILFSFITGIVLFTFLLVIEYKLLARVVYFFDQKLHPRYPIEIEDEDDDVAKEKEIIKNTMEMQIGTKYTLVIKDLTKYYKNFLAVNGLSLGIGKSECFGLLGINGAGKTTTFKMMSGDERISYGDGWVSGCSIKSQLKQVQRNIGYCPQFDALLDDMTAMESIIMYCLLRGIELERTKVIADFLSKEFDFHRHLNKKVKEMSGGNKRKLSTVLSLIGDPPVLFLDEPTTGMDPATKRYLWNSLCRIRDSGKTIVLTSHSMEECEALCTRIAIMVNGNFKCLGSTQHLKNKFAEGYTLTIKVKKLSNSAGLQHSETEPIEKFIRNNFPGSHLREKHQELLNYYVVDKSMSWSTMFGILEKGKRSDLNIEDYSLGQSSLEQVFLTFTKHQVEEE